jgi:hypothetical protein
MLTRGNRDSGNKKDRKLELTLSITCRSQSFTNITIKTATAMHFSKLEEVLTEIALRQSFYKKCVVEGEGINEKATK